MQLTPEIEALWEKAQQYDQIGDAYNAIKLYKGLTRKVPEWVPPFLRLASIYQSRQEWKSALHYIKKSVSLDSSNKSAWWDLGIAATALKKWRLAKNVWNKFGSPVFREQVAVRIRYQDQFEIVWTQPLDPCQGIILNIPHPDSGRRYGDVVLFDREVRGYNIVQQKRYPVFDELGVFKRSHFRTFSCVLDDVSGNDIQILREICQNAGLGFEVWSNASRAMAPAGYKSLPEYYGDQLERPVPEKSILVAIAARKEGEVREILNSWKVISLKNYSDLKSYQ